MTIAGLFAAVATPIHADGRVDFRTLDRLVDFLVEAGASGVCLAGATGEYPHFETADRKAIIRRAADRLPRDRALLVGIGAPSMRHDDRARRDRARGGQPRRCCCRCRCSSATSRTIWRPSARTSAARFARRACSTTSRTSPTGSRPATVLNLLRDEEFIVGIKDSSGAVENLAAFAQARQRTAVDAARRRRPCFAEGAAGRMGRRHLRRGRVLPGAAGGDLPQLRRRPAETRPHACRRCSTS